MTPSSTIPSPRSRVRQPSTITSRHHPHTLIHQQAHVTLHYHLPPCPMLKTKPWNATSLPTWSLQQRHFKLLKQKYISFLAQLNKHIWYSSHSGTKVCWHWFRQQGSNWKASEGDCRGWKEALCHKRRSSHWCSLQECCWWAEAMGLLHQHLPYLCKIQQSSPGGTQPQCLLCEGI